MTLDEVREVAQDIADRYGRTVIFREPSKRVSYQAISGTEADLPPGAVFVEYVDPSTSKHAAYWAEQASLARVHANSRPAHDLKGFFSAHRDAERFDRLAAALSHLPHVRSPND